MESRKTKQPIKIVAISDLYLTVEYLPIRCEVIHSCSAVGVRTTMARCRINGS